MKKYLVLTLIALVGVVAHSKDMGFRFKNGKCVDAAGKAGLNPGYVGQCADLQHVTMSRFPFDDTDLSGSLFSDADLQEATFKRSDLTAVNFTNANLSGADFDQAIAVNVNFSKAVMINTHLGSAKLQNSDLRGADLSGGLLSYVSLPGALLAGAIFDRATMDHANLSGADLSGVSFTAVNLKSASLDGAKIAKANFTSADLTAASLKKATGTEIKFRRAILRQADLTEAVITGSDCFYAQMDSAILKRANLNNVDLRAAVLKGASTDGASFKGAQFSSRTVLPFSASDAAKLGMVAGKSGNLLVIWDSEDNKTQIAALKAALDLQGIDLTVSPQSHAKFDGKMKLDDYTTILHITGIDYDTDMSANGQKALVAFVNAGGTYIGTQYSGYMIDQNNKLAGLRDLLLISYASSDGEEHKFMPMADKESHPLLENLSEFSVKADMSLGPLHAFQQNPAYTVMQDAAGIPMVAARTYGKGKIVGLAFAINTDSSVLTEAPVQQLIQNAVYW